MKRNRVIVSALLVSALLGAGAPVATADTPGQSRQAVSSVHRVALTTSPVPPSSTSAVSPAAIPSAVSTTTSGGAASGASAYGPSSRIVWLINKLKGLGGTAWNKLKSAARQGYAKFKEVYERVVPWLVRKTIEIGFTIYEVYSAVREFIGL
ncbi:hypothetical protein JNUCC64_03405 [Streptomyces sp. JNUCC 64]